MSTKTKLKTVLDERGIKQSWLADKIGVSIATMSSIASGNRKLSKSKALAIASVLHVELNAIYDEV